MTSSKKVLEPTWTIWNEMGYFINQVRSGSSTGERTAANYNLNQNAVSLEFGRQDICESYPKELW